MNTRMKFLRRYIVGTGAPLDPFEYVEIGQNANGKDLSTVAYLGTKQTPTVPKAVGPDTVLWVGDTTFEGDENITSVNISNGIDQIR